MSNVEAAFFFFFVTHRESWYPPPALTPHAEGHRHCPLRSPTTAYNCPDPSGFTQRLIHPTLLWARKWAGLRRAVLVFPVTWLGSVGGTQVDVGLVWTVGVALLTGQALRGKAGRREGGTEGLEENQHRASHRVRRHTAAGSQLQRQPLGQGRSHSDPASVPNSSRCRGRRPPMNIRIQKVTSAG